MASCAAAFRHRDLVVFQLQIVKNFQSAHRTRDYIFIKCYLINSRYEKEEKKPIKVKRKSQKNPHFD